MTTAEIPPDFGVIDPITLPSDGKMPDGAGSSSRAEYDRYFRLERRSPGLASWSQTCLQVQRNVLRDLDRTDLTAEDRCDILAGCVTVLHSTLERWLDGIEEAER
jgi:hypothetical protein